MIINNRNIGWVNIGYCFRGYNLWMIKKSAKDSIRVKELEFYATQTVVVTILPNFNDEELYLISGEFGPFRANQEVDVPLWLAINLKQSKKCNFVIPSWLTLEMLQEILEI